MHSILPAECFIPVALSEGGNLLWRLPGRVHRLVLAARAIPAILWSGRSKPKYLGTDELWFAGSGQRNCAAQCGNNFSGPQIGFGDRIGYASVVLPTTTTGVPTLTGVDVLRSSIRCMPSSYDNGRIYPMPLAGGSPRLLYSASNDLDFGGGAYCNQTGVYTFFGMYIVVTAF